MERFASVDALVLPPARKPHGIYVTARCGFALILLTVLIASVIGLLFNFVVTRRTLETPTARTAGQTASFSALRGGGGGDDDLHRYCVCNTSAAILDLYNGPPSDAYEGANGRQPLQFRLPKDLLPYQYTVDLRANIYDSDPQQFTLNGTVKIRFMCLKSTSFITLHKWRTTDLINYSLRHADGSTGTPKIIGYDFNNVTSVLNFTLTGALITGRNYTVMITFQTPLEDDNSGLFYRSYQASDGTKRYMVASQMQPTDARKAFPCFDEPAMKAVFTLSLWRKQSMITMSNMPIRDTLASSDGWLVDRYYDTPLMSTYILAMAVCDYTHVSTSAGNRNSVVRVWAPENMVGNTAYALNAAANITNYFEKLFDEDFPLPKQDMIFVPELPGLAMENWGLITYVKEGLFLHPLSSLAREKLLVAKVVAHEIAHQWFGNLVSPSWWSEIWLNEGLSSYLQYLGVAYIEKDWEVEMQSLALTVFPAKLQDSQPFSHAIRRQLSSPREIHDCFDLLLYDKGASITRQAHFFLGDEVFFGGLKKYLKTWKYQSVNEEDLFAAWQEEATRAGLRQNVSNIMQTWTNQGGYPLITVTYKDKSNHQAKQELFCQTHNATCWNPPDSQFGHKWYVPLTVVSDKRPFFNLTHRDVTWMSRHEDTKDLAIDFSKWFLINAGAYGFYRVNYENVIWDALAEQLQANHEVIHESNRAQLIDDAYNLARFQYIGIEKALAITNYLKKETKYVPLEVGLKELGHIGDLLLSRLSFGHFSAYMKKLLTEPYRRLGRFSEAYRTDFNHPSTDMLQRISKIIIASSCLYDVDDCRDTAKKLFDLWMVNGTAIPLHARAAAYCYGVRSSGSAGWEYAFSRYGALSDDDADRAHLLESLACTTEPWLLNRLLVYSLNGTMIARDLAPTVIKQIASTAIGKFVAWSFIRTNWLNLYLKDERYVMLPLLEIMKMSSSEQELKDVIELSKIQFHTFYGLPSGELSIAEHEIRKNIDFLNTNEARIVAWLQNS